MHITEDHTNAAVRTRRQHSDEFKARMVKASLRPGASVSALALEHGLNANLLFAWRRAHLRSQARAAEAPSGPPVLPVVFVADQHETLEPSAAPALFPAVPDVTRLTPAAPISSSGSHIDLRICGVDLRLHGRVDEHTLRLVLQLVRVPSSTA